MGAKTLETLVGAAVLAAAVFFLAFAYEKADIADVAGYRVHAEFQSVGGLKVGDDVRIAGIGVGSVIAMELVPDIYVARVTMNIQPGIALAEDTLVAVASEGLLGGHYIQMSPGAGGEAVGDGHVFLWTQDAVNLMDVVSRALFGGVADQ